MSDSKVTPVNWNRLTPAERERLESLAQRVHDDFERGEMHLMYRGNSRGATVKERMASIPIVTLPHCWHGDCIVNTSPPPPWPQDCTCEVVEGRDHSRDWQADCPAHGRESSWSWAADVRER